MINTNNYGGLISLNESLKENTGMQVKFVNVKAGYSHALIQDSEGQIFTYGSGAFGQLG